MRVRTWLAVVALGLAWPTRVALAEEAPVAAPGECATGMDCPVGQSCEDGRCAGMRPPPRLLEDDLQLRNDTPRQGHHVETRRRWGIFIPGMAMFATVWAGAVALGFLGVPEAAIPLSPIYLGPHLLSEPKPANCGDYSACGGETSKFMFGVLLTIDGIVQLAGFIMMAVGALSTHEVEVSDSPPPAVLLPLLLPGGGGLSVVARF